jgi:TRAP-type C4-dicarboxylate transport system permease small subunit
MRLYQTTLNFIDIVFRPVSIISWKAGGWALAGMMVITAGDVFFRSVFNHPIRGTIDITECLMPILTSSGLAYVAITKSHINADVLFRFLSRRVQLVLNIFTGFFSFVFSALVSWQSFVNMRAEAGFGVTTGVLPIPIYPFVGIVAYSMLLLTGVLLRDLLELLLELKR